MYDIQALYEAQSAQDAVRLLTEHPGAQIIAGGSDVLVQIREGRRAQNWSVFTALTRCAASAWKKTAPCASVP